MDGLVPSFVWMAVPFGKAGDEANGHGKDPARRPAPCSRDATAERLHGFKRQIAC